MERMLTMVRPININAPRARSATPHLAVSCAPAMTRLVDAVWQSEGEFRKLLVEPLGGGKIEARSPRRARCKSCCTPRSCPPSPP
jgi:hypothetical protein